jgi:predicted unusual protein kinase regulating ubiquinone biosynthesis (AarF/ABC1/UbiB family)
LACPDGRLCYLDFGMMSYADRAQRNGFLLAVVHIVNRDWAALVRVYQKLGFIPEGTDVTPIEIALENALPDVLSADISELNFKNVINKLGDVVSFCCVVSLVILILAHSFYRLTDVHLPLFIATILHCHYSMFRSIGRCGDSGETSIVEAVGWSEIVAPALK